MHYILIISIPSLSAARNFSDDFEICTDVMEVVWNLFTTLSHQLYNSE